jgi:peptidyl-prolyl cis-trans isomerase-like protein 2
LAPFKTPVCTKEGVIFDLLNIIPYIVKFHTNPVDGKPLSQSDLIRLNFSKNAKGEYHCPITLKTFNEFSTIVAIPETGNVFSMQAYERFNKGPKNYKDILNDKPFDPAKIIILQDPTNLRMVNDLDYMKKKESQEFSMQINSAEGD